jgi:hypothetical protein
LKIVCSDLSVDTGETWEKIERKFYKLDKTVKDTNVKIHGQVGRIIGCLPLRFDATSTREEDKNEQTYILQTYYQVLWKQMKQRTFTIYQSNCDYSGKYLYINESLDVNKTKSIKRNTD